MIKEDGAPTNNAGGGGVAGIGVGPQGEPGVSPRHQPKKNRSVPNPIIADMLRRRTPVSEGDVSNFVPKPPKRKVKVAGGNKDEIEQQSKKLEKYHRARREAEANKWQKHRLSEETFAGATVFEVSSHTFHNAKMEKRKGKHWRTYLDECDELSEIREYANKHPKRPIVLQNRNTNEMVYVRYGKAR